jgi:hypothetical protein
MTDASLTSADQQPERPQLERYQSDDDQLVLYNPSRLEAEWIAADPSDVMEVVDGLPDVLPGVQRRPGPPRGLPDLSVLRLLEVRPR